MKTTKYLINADAGMPALKIEAQFRDTLDNSTDYVQDHSFRRQVVYKLSCTKIMSIVFRKDVPIDPLPSQTQCVVWAYEHTEKIGKD